MAKALNRISDNSMPATASRIASCEHAGLARPFSRFQTLRQIPSNLIRDRFAAGVCWSFAGAAATQCLTLLAVIIAGRILGPAGYGRVGIIQSTIGMFGIFAGMGLGLTATKYVAELRDTDPQHAGRVVALTLWTAVFAGIVAVFALWVWAPQLAAVSLHAPELSTDLRIATILLFSNAFQGVQSGILAGFGDFKAIAGLSVLRGLAICAAFAVAVPVWQVRGAVRALAVSTALAAVISQIPVHKACVRAGARLDLRHAWVERSLLWRFSLPSMLGGVIAVPAAWLASTIVLRQPGGFAELGIFNAANQWRLAITFLPSVLAQPLLERLSHLNAARCETDYLRLLCSVLLLTLLVVTVIAACAAAASSRIMAAYGTGFAAASSVLLLLAAAAVLDSIASIMGYAIASLGKMWIGFALNCGWAVVLLTATGLLAPKYGANGLAAANLIAYATHATTVSACTFWLILSRHTGSRPGWDIKQRYGL